MSTKEDRKNAKDIVLMQGSREEKGVRMEEYIVIERRMEIYRKRRERKN